MERLRGKNVVLGVSGGISAYKAVEVLRRLTEVGINVRVVMTKAATEFVTPLTFRELSYSHVALEMFEEPKGPLMQHLGWMEWADLMIVAPATANVINKMAVGVADNLLMTMLLSATCPILIAPAMDSDMYTNPITQQNIARLQQLGVFFIGPESGPLARRNVGPGRLIAPVHIAEKAFALLQAGERGRRDKTYEGYDMTGTHVLVTAGPTYEAIDPVRFIGNRSSGKMGFALARAAVQRGATVTLVSGPVSLQTPFGANRIDVRTALEMREAVMEALPTADIVIMAAAVADYRVEHAAKEKMKKADLGSNLSLKLVANPDIAAEIGAAKRPDQTLVAFAAETRDLAANARRKLETKRCELMVANDVSAADAGFEVNTNRVRLFSATGMDEQLPLLPKEDVADRILDAVKKLRTAAND